jgi:hypothetical protein
MRYKPEQQYGRTGVQERSGITLAYPEHREVNVRNSSTSVAFQHARG